MLRISRNKDINFRAKIRAEYLTGVWGILYVLLLRLGSVNGSYR